MTIRPATLAEREAFLEHDRHGRVVGSTYLPFTYCVGYHNKSLLYALINEGYQDEGSKWGPILHISGEPVDRVNCLAIASALLEARGNWTSEAPIKEGVYWFFGEPFRHAKVGFDARLFCIEIIKFGEKLMGKADGRVMELRQFSPSVNKVGYWGKWCPANIPPLPSLDAPPVINQE